MSDLTDERLRELHRRYDDIPPSIANMVDVDTANALAEYIALRASPPSPAGAVINLWNWQSHPLAKQFSELAGQVEALGASTALTDVAIAISDLRQQVQDALNAHPIPVQDAPAGEVVAWRYKPRGRTDAGAWSYTIGSPPIGDYWTVEPLYPLPPSTERDAADALAEFTEYFVRNYPGPDTIIGDPHWHAPKIFRAARHALKATPASRGDHIADVGKMVPTTVGEGAAALLEVFAEMFQANGDTASWAMADTMARKVRAALTLQDAK